MLRFFLSRHFDSADVCDKIVKVNVIRAREADEDGELGEREISSLITFGNGFICSYGNNTVWVVEQVVRVVMTVVMVVVMMVGIMVVSVMVIIV